MDKRIRNLAVVTICTVLVIQVVRPGLENPSLRSEPRWDSPRTRELARTACFDCHSNETVYPWYAQVAPMRWLIWHHVQEGREHLNFSDPSKKVKLDEIADELHEGGMPTWDYKLLHPKARLTKAQSDSLLAGLKATFGGKASPEDRVVAPLEESKADGPESEPVRKED